MENSLFNIGKIFDACDDEPTTAQIDVAKEWAKLVTDKKLEDEVKNYFKFGNKILLKLLGYDEDDIGFEESAGRKRVEFSIKDNTNKLKLVIELKGQNVDLDKPQKRGKKFERSPVDQAFTYAIENKGVQWIIVSNYKETRLYNYYHKKRFISFTADDLLVISNLKIFLCLLSKTNFLINKLPDKILNDTLLVDKQFTKDFYKLYHATRLEIARQIQTGNPSFSIKKIVSLTQLILNRIIFIAFTEDRNLLPSETLIETILPPIKSRDVSKTRQEIWRKLNLLFDDINNGKEDKDISQYNGAVFKEDLSFLKIVDLFSHSEKKNIAYNHGFDYSEIEKLIGEYKSLNPIYKNFLLISQTNFKDERSIDILGHVFEQSILDIERIADIGLDKIIEETLSRSKKKGKSKKRKSEGIFYTPEMVTLEITKTALIRYLSDDDKITTIEGLINEFEGNITSLEDKLTNIKITDIACGSGAFLSQLTNLILELFEKIHQLKIDQGFFVDDPLKEFFDPSLKKMEIVTNNIFGADISSQAIEIAKLSLFLKIAHKKDKLPDLDSNFTVGNSVISDSSVVTDAIDWENLTPNKFHIIVINPPYIPTEMLPEGDRSYFSGNFAVSGKYDTSVIFLQKALGLLEDGGVLGAIVPLTWQTGVNYRLFREEIFKISKIITLINLPFDIFPDAYVDTGIVILEKTPPSQDDSFRAYQFDKRARVATLHIDEWETIPFQYVLEYEGKNVFTTKAFYTFQNKIKLLFEGGKAKKLGDLTVSRQGYYASRLQTKKTQPDINHIPFYTKGLALRHFVIPHLSEFVDINEWERLKPFYCTPKLFIRRIINRQDRLMAFYVEPDLLTTKDYNPFVLIKESEWYKSLLE
ncbi:hypothetical protein CEE45_05215 [Candidatus Heimdallarchaeota archaeon B3_Heim]|nr:MAG: hypothetical protein CEE45_05215 [Candidatus Heimdallarchaeota archaeon B3_Heim]